MSGRERVSNLDLSEEDQAPALGSEGAGLGQVARAAAAPPAPRYQAAPVPASSGSHRHPCVLGGLCPGATPAGDQVPSSFLFSLQFRALWHPWVVVLQRGRRPELTGWQAHKQD